MVDTQEKTYSSRTSGGRGGGKKTFYLMVSHAYKTRREALAELNLKMCSHRVSSACFF